VLHDEAVYFLRLGCGGSILAMLIYDQTATGMERRKLCSIVVESTEAFFNRRRREISPTMWVQNRQEENIV
jgi:hypothetical protein